MTRTAAVLLAAALMLGLAAAPAHAGARATLILTNGDRVSGVLVDMGGADFTMMEGGNEVRFPIGQVAVIDFSGGGQNIPASDVSKMQSGRAMVVQRNGDVYYGRLVDIRGDNPLRLVINSDGTLEVNSSDIARIYLRRWEGMPSGSGGGGRGSDSGTTGGGNRPAESGGRTRPTEAGGLSVPASVVWVDTGIQVRVGSMVSFNAQGEVVLSGDDNDKAGPGGAFNGRVANMGAHMPGVAAGALVARIGSSTAFGIGNQSQALRMPYSGVLYLGVNDESPNNNRGEFRVQINVVR